MVEVLVTNLQNKAEHGVVFQCPSDTPPPRDSQNTRPSSLRRSHKGERSQNERHHPALCELVFSPLPPFRFSSKSMRHVAANAAEEGGCRAIGAFR